MRGIVRVIAKPEGRWHVICRERGQFFTFTYSRQECPDALSAVRAAMRAPRTAQ